MGSNILVKVYISCMETSIEKGLAIAVTEENNPYKE
jgi:hypothetical protein